MKNKLFTLAAALMLAAVVAGIFATPAVAAAIKAVLVKNIDERGRSPYLKIIGCTPMLPSDFCEATAPEAIPADKRLVLERISGLVVSSPGNVVSGSLKANPGATRGYFQFNDPLGPLGFSILNEEVLAYWEPGTTPVVQLSASGGVGGNIVIAGYLVDLSNE